MLLKTKLINSLTPLTFDAGRNAFWKIFDEYYFGRLCVEKRGQATVKIRCKGRSTPPLVNCYIHDDDITGMIT